MSDQPSALDVLWAKSPTDASAHFHPLICHPIDVAALARRIASWAAAHGHGKACAPCHFATRDTGAGRRKKAQRKGARHVLQPS